MPAFDHRQITFRNVSAPRRLPMELGQRSTAVIRQNGVAGSRMSRAIFAVRSPRRLLFDGYYCDFNRNWAFGHASDEAKRAYELCWQATEAGLAALRPGAKASDLFATSPKYLA